MVHHVHGTIGNNGNLIVGYGNAQFEKSDFEPDMEEIDKELILNILRENRKPVEIIIQAPKFHRFMSLLSNVSSVIVFGHSFSQVDKPYFSEIANNIKDDAKWLFYVHNADNNTAVRSYADKVLQNKQIVEITNTCPFGMLCC